MPAEFRHISGNLPAAVRWNSAKIEHPM
jgi:hypothetical protein